MPEGYYEIDLAEPDGGVVDAARDTHLLLDGKPLVELGADLLDLAVAADEELR